MSKKALITGITGQDGSYLAEFLLAKGYEVYGVKRRSASFNEERISHIKNDNFHLYYGDMTDTGNLISMMQEIKPDEVYNLAAQSHVGTSWKIPEYTANVDGVGVLRILEAIRSLGLKSKFYQASTSELFAGEAKEGFLKESTPFHPQSPYAIAKLFGYWTVRAYRDAYNIFACNGILFNHESPRRGENFVTRKITLAASRIHFGLQEKLFLGNLDAKRDWGYAKDYVEMMWLMLQAEKPDDYVIATGENHSVKEFCEIAFKEAGIELVWKGEGMLKKGIDKKTNQIVIEVDPKFFRPVEVASLLGDATKAKKELEWFPKTSFSDLVKIMVKSDLEKAKKEFNAKSY